MVESMAEDGKRLFALSPAYPWPDVAEENPLWCLWHIIPGSIFRLVENDPDVCQRPNGDIIKTWLG